MIKKTYTCSLNLATGILNLQQNTSKEKGIIFIQKAQMCPFYSDFENSFFHRNQINIVYAM